MRLRYLWQLMLLTVVKAGLGSAYLQSIIRDYNTDVRTQVDTIAEV